MAWRVAKSLDQLLAEINASAPNRSKASDGSIGDEDHQTTNSDHNAHCQGWVVTARDFTHDPANGFDSYAYADWQRQRCRGDILINGTREIRVKYIISNRRIASPTDNWAWRTYNGENAHDKHCHVSVDCTAEGGYMDSTEPWGWKVDMEQKEALTANTGLPGRTIGQFYGDSQNLRNYLVGAPGSTSVGQPGATSRVDLLVQAAQKVLAGTIGAPTQEQVNIAVKAALLDPEVLAAITEAAFQGAQQAERE